MANWTTSVLSCTDKYTLLKLGTCNDFEIIVSTEEPQLSFLISFKVIFEKLRCSLIINYRKYFSKNLSFLLWVDWIQLSTETMFIHIIKDVSKTGGILNCIKDNEQFFLINTLLILNEVIFSSSCLRLQLLQIKFKWLYLVEMEIHIVIFWKI